MVDGIINQIDDVVSRINTHPEYSLCATREKSHALREEAEKHSLDLELASEDRKLSTRERSDFLLRLNKAYDLLAREGITRYTLSKLGPLIEPDNNPTGGFRNEYISFGGFHAPDPEVIPYKIEGLIDVLRNSNIHPVTRAANAHLGLVEIHPFMDGNGRSARLLQNFCLEQRKYPVVVIPTDDLREYIETIHNALRDRFKGDSSAQQPSESEQRFHDFISQRVLRSAFALDDELKQRRIYCVEMNKVRDPRISGKVSSKLRNFGRRDEEGGVSVTIKKNNGNKRSWTLKVIGNIGTEDVDSILRSSSERYGFNYEVRPGC